MRFVGRDAEIARAEAALAHGLNLLVVGKYGIGRTALVRELARRNRAWRFVFADFGQSGARISAAILAHQSGRSRHQVRATRKARRLARAVAEFVPPPRVERLVIVVDDVAKVTRPKFELLRLLGESGRLAVVAIVERFVRSEDVMRIRVALDPATVLTLDALDLKTSTRFFAAAAAELDLPWSASDVGMLARTTHGYPLEMVRTVQAARRRSEKARPCPVSM